MALFLLLQLASSPAAPTAGAAAARLSTHDAAGLNLQLDAWGEDAMRIRIGAAIDAVPSTQALLDEQRGQLWGSYDARVGAARSAASVLSSLEPGETLASDDRCRDA